jgi:hypothetical protein
MKSLPVSSSISTGVSSKKTNFKHFMKTLLNKKSSKNISPNGPSLKSHQNHLQIFFTTKISKIKPKISTPKFCQSLLSRKTPNYSSSSPSAPARDLLAWDLHDNCHRASTCCLADPSVDAAQWSRCRSQLYSFSAHISSAPAVAGKCDVAPDRRLQRV